MWGKLLQEVRRVGPKKIAIFTVAAAIAVIFAYGDNSSDNAATGRTLPRAMLRSHMHMQTHLGARGSQAVLLPADAAHHSRH